MKTKRLIQFSMGVAVVLLGPAACDVKDPIYDTPHPEQGTLTITTDWGDIGQGIDKPSDYTLILGDKTFPVSKESYTVPEKLDPGSYTLYFHNRAEHITVRATTATVGSPTTLVRAGEADIHPLPGWFITGKLEATIEKDKEHHLTVTMTQQVRELTLLIEPTGDTADEITSINARLSGVAGSLDFSSNTHATASTVPLTFTKQPAGNQAGKWIATIRLLGIVGSEQQLTGTISFKGGSPGDIALSSDLSSALSQFNELKKEPLTLDGQVIETPSGVDFTATIKEWIKVPGGSGIAN